MNDTASSWLLSQLNRDYQQGLLIADENCLALAGGLQQIERDGLRAISNRFDVAQQLTSSGLSCDYSDFDFSAIADNSLDCIFYRLSKEKPVVHHIINQAFRCLKPGGQLLFSGFKNDGIKTYTKKANARFGDGARPQKQGLNYWIIITKQAATSEPLDDSDYNQLRALGELASHGQQLSVSSKPGIFGWNKVDQGSEFLIDYLPEFIGGLPHKPRTLLDLGCGYGYLSLAASLLPQLAKIEHWTATDNNAAAIRAAEHNLQQLVAQDRQLSVTADDCGQQLRQQADIILCNPPFHQGFSIDGELTHKFLQQSQRLLAKGGAALFVVNQFIPLEKKARQYFGTVTTVAENRSFKLVQLAH